MSDMHELKQKIHNIWLNPSCIDSVLGGEGYGLPDINNLAWQQLDGENNWAVCAPDAHKSNGRNIRISDGARNNVFILGSEAKASGEYSLRGSNSVYIIAGGDPGNRINIYAVAEECTFFWGRESWVNTVNVFMQGERRKIFIGENCLFSHGVNLRNNDDHAIVDIETGEWVNKPGDIYIEPKVWVGPEVVVLKDTTVGFGSILAQRSVISNDVERFSIAAGVPARILRRGVVWNRPTRPQPEHVEKAKQRAEKVPVPIHSYRNKKL